MKASGTAPTRRGGTATAERPGGGATRPRGTGAALVGLLVAAAGLAATGCGRQARVESEPSTPAPEPATWSATLSGSVGSALRGRATAERTASGTRVRVTLRDLAPGARLPWHVHQGRCGSEGEIVGTAAAYPLLEAPSGGEASASAELGLRLDPALSYYVNVHASPDDLGSIVACGQLRAG